MSNKTARLDQILFSLGYTDQDQITRALRRQQSSGGRFGMSLVQLGVITEEQLVTALAEQFRIPILTPGVDEISSALVERMPPDLVSNGLAIPLSWNDAQKVLSVAIVNPSDIETMKRVKDAFNAKGIRVALAPETFLAELGAILVPLKSRPGSGEGGITLPELFAPEPALMQPVENRPAAAETPAQPRPEVEQTGRVLMVSAAASRKNFLPPVFEREGLALSVASEKAEIASIVQKGDLKGVLVSREMAEEFSTWLHDGSVETPASEVLVFDSVSSALLQNPLPYDATIRSLKSSVQALADYRCAQLGASPPYGLIASDVDALAELHGLRRIVADALNLCVHLLLPAGLPPGTDPVGAAGPFGAFASSLELATRIRFPWKLDSLLAACHALYSGAAAPSERGDWSEEKHVAAQILAITCYRHIHIQAPSGTDEERMIAVRTSLREVGGRLATQDLIEGYLHTITERGGVAEDLGNLQVLLVGAERVTRALTSTLERVGRQVLATGDLADAQTMAQRRAPAAIVIDYEEFPGKVDKFSRVANLGGAALLFVLTDSTDPSLVLNLLGVGVDDVFGPPHDFDLVAARINRSIRSRSRDRTEEKPQAGQFSATFEVFSFLDLIQMLGQGLKTVRIELSRGDEKATILMQKGRLTHAELGDVQGEAAVYAVIGWDDDGEFTVKKESSFPHTTIEAATESVLMEGVRRQDESKRGIASQVDQSTRSVAE